MKRLEILVAVAMLVLAAVVAVGTRGLDFWLVRDFAPGPAFLPLLVAGVAVVLSILVILEARARVADVAVDWPDSAGSRRVLLSTAALWIFLMIAPWLGFTISTALLVLFMLVVVAGRDLVASLVTTIITAGLIQIIFLTWLQVALPKGILGF